MSGMQDAEVTKSLSKGKAQMCPCAMCRDHVPQCLDQNTTKTHIKNNCSLVSCLKNSLVRKLLFSEIVGSLAYIMHFGF